MKRLESYLRSHNTLRVEHVVRAIDQDGNTVAEAPSELALLHELEAQAEKAKAERDKASKARAAAKAKAKADSK